MKRSEKLFCYICNQNRKFKFKSNSPAYFQNIRNFKCCHFCKFEIHSNNEFEYTAKDINKEYILYYKDSILKIENKFFERFKLKPILILENIGFEDYIAFCKNKKFIKKIKDNNIFY